MGVGVGDNETETRDAKRRRKAVPETATKKPAEEEPELEQENNKTASQTADGQKTPVKENIDYYQGSLTHEESEVKSRTEIDDKELFSKICQHIRSLMKEILNLKADKPEGWSGEAEERRVQVVMLMMSLRRLSRIQKVRVRDSRDQTGEARQGVDSVTLQLQNLLYEIAHLKKEVRRCLEFRSADQEIDLVPLEQFYLEAPEDISRPAETVEDPHQQRLAQLHWELEQRRGQTELFDKLSNEKEKIADLIVKQERKLASLSPRINSILEATKPLQEALDLPLDSNREQQRTAHLLPMPLYTLWVQASAYTEACDPNIKVEIMGDLEAARKLIAPEEESRTDVSDSDNEQEPAEESVSRKSRSRRKARKADVDDNDEAVKQMLGLHPLTVSVIINTKDANSVTITFSYAQILRIVTTKCSVQLVEKRKSLLTDVLSGDSLLFCLFPGDDGNSSPNPATTYQMQKSRINLNDNMSIIGRPYSWAQNLCGLTFLRPDAAKTVLTNVGSEDDYKEATPEMSSATIPPRPPGDISSSEISAEHMHSTIFAVRRRLQARLALHTQLLNLDTATSTSSIAISTELLSHFPGKVSSELKSWRPVAWNDYVASSATSMLIESGVVAKQHYLFKASFERKAVRLDALVAVSPDYPNVVPVSSLTLQWHGQHSAATNPHVRHMESEINVFWEEMVSSRNERLHILPLMLYRLAMCLDVYTEAACAHTDAHGSETQFHKEKIFFRPARGPDRAYPFKYLPKLGVFAQR